MNTEGKRLHPRHQRCGDGPGRAECAKHDPIDAEICVRPCPSVVPRPAPRGGVLL